MSEENKNNKYICYNGPVENADQHGHKKLKIGVSGAAETGTCGLDALEIAKEIGREVVRQGGVLITGASSGFPVWSSMGAKEEHGIVFGFSPASSEEEHIKTYRLPTDYNDLIIYTGFGYPGRDLLFTRACDAIIIGCGRIGTIHEFTIAFEDGKPTGILKGPWITDTELESIVKNSGRPSEHVIFDDDPKRLVQRLVKMVEERKATLYNNH